MISQSKLSLFGLLAINFIIIICQSKQLPPYILPCSKSDPQLNVCIKNSFNHLRNYLPDGLPELGVQPLEPLEIDEVGMENNAGAVRIKAKFLNIKVKGASNYTVRDVRNDISKLRIDMSLFIPRVEVTGKYDVAGNVLLLPVRSHGHFWAEFTNISAIAKVYGQERLEDNKKYMNIGKLLIDFTMKNAVFQIVDKVRTDNLFGEAINQFLNTNSKELVREMRPAATKSVSKIFQKILNGAFSRIEIKDWLLK